MKILLIEEINNLGNAGSIVNVKNGYANNFLFPKNKAVLATNDNIKKFNEDNFSKIKSKNIDLNNFIDLLEKIKKIENIKIFRKSGKNGKLFGSINSLNIKNILLEENKINIDKKKIIIPKNGLRYIGLYKIKIHIYEKIFTYLNIEIINK